MSIPEVHLQRHLVTCRVLGQGPAGERALRSAVDDGLRSDLEDALGAVGLHGYWVIRRVDVRAQVGATWSSSEMGVALARGIARQVADLARGGNNAETALWFPDRAAFLSRFLVDLAEGRHLGRWEYAQFADLQGRTHAGVLLAAAEPVAFADALMLLSPGDLDSVVAALEADAVLATLAVPGPVDITPIIDAAGRLLPGGRLDVPRGAALVLAVTAARDGGVALAEVASAAREVADVLAVVRSAGPRSEDLVQAIRDGRWRDVAALAGSADSYLPLVRWSVEQRLALADAVTQPPRNVVEDERVHTPWGGGLLLVPLLDDLWDWSEATRGWPEGADNVVKLLCVAACLGRGANLAPAADPVLRAALGVLADLDVSIWLAGVTYADVIVFDEVAGLAAPVADGALATSGSPTDRFVSRAARALAGELGRRLPGMAEASPAYLWRNVLDVDAWVTFEEHSAVVELGHAPLSVLLAMAGLDRASFVVGEVRWTLTTRP